jgi:hypothetical protein
MTTATIQKRHAENSAESWPKSYKCRFIEPGLVAYQDFGTVLVQKNALDSMMKSFKGKPVINEVHKDVEPKIYEEGKADGIVVNAWYDSEDGWFWADFLVWDETTQRNIESCAYSVSCAYNLGECKVEGGVHNNIPYSREILGGEYTHLAIVANPRYEGARIVCNSLEGGGMKLKFWNLFKSKDGKTVKNAGEGDLEGKTVLIDGEQVPLQVLIDTFRAEAAEKAKMEELEGGISEDTVIEIDGSETAVRDMANSYRSAKARKNAEDEEKKKDEKEKEAENAGGFVVQKTEGGFQVISPTGAKMFKDGMEPKTEQEAKEAAADFQTGYDKYHPERKNAEEEEAKKKEAEEKEKDAKNAEEEEKKKKDDEEEAKNSMVDEGLKTAANTRYGAPQQPVILGREERIAVGSRRYGSTK